MNRDQRVPGVALPADVSDRLAALGGKANSLYEAIANQPRLLRAWVEFVWTVRNDCATPRALRELAILRTAQVVNSSYELQAHHEIALALGIPEQKLRALADWRESELFGSAERAALDFTEALLLGTVPDSVASELDQHFDAGARVELAMTVTLYEMVARVIVALGVPLESGDTRNAGPRAE